MAKRETRVSSVIVTGASSGIGLACVRELHSNSYEVIAGVRSTESCEKMRTLFGSKVWTFSVDVTCEQSIFAAYKVVTEKLADIPGPFGVINSIGASLVKPVELIRPSEFLGILQTNVLGPLAFTQKLFPLLRKRGGRIVYIGSTSSHIPSVLTGAYSASKAALESIVATQRLELDRSGIQVTTVEPGVVATPFWLKSREQEQVLEIELAEFGIRRYEELLQRRMQTPFTADDKGISASTTARIVRKALETSRLKKRYIVGSDAHLKLLVHRLLPGSLFEKLQLTRYR